MIIVVTENLGIFTYRLRCIRSLTRLIDRWHATTKYCINETFVEKNCASDVSHHLYCDAIGLKWEHLNAQARLADYFPYHHLAHVINSPFYCLHSLFANLFLDFMHSMAKFKQTFYRRVGPTIEAYGGSCASMVPSKYFNQLKTEACTEYEQVESYFYI